MLKLLSISGFGALLGSTAMAATVSFMVEVTESNFSMLNIPNAPTATLPALGETGTLTISLPGLDASNTDPFGNPDGPPNAGSVTASITVGSLSASLDPGFGSIAFASDTQVRFANGSFSSINVSFPRDPGATPTYAGSFRIETPADGNTPSTFGDVVAALTDADTTAFFSFNGTTFDGIDTSFRVDTIAVAPIPLPAGGVLFGTAILGAFAAGSWRKRQG